MSFWNFLKTPVTDNPVSLYLLRALSAGKLKSCFCYILLCIPLFSIAQTNADNNANTPVPLQTTRVSGVVVDAATGTPLPFVAIRFGTSKYGGNSDGEGKFSLSAPGAFSTIIVSYMGFQSLTKAINPGQNNSGLQLRLQASHTQLKEVKVTSGKKQKYRNKGNPAVEVIQRVIDHKPENRMESADYLQNEQYERINLSFVDIPSALINNRFFRMYKFMLDTIQKDGRQQVLLPAYFSEKISQNYYRKQPTKSIKILKAEKEVNIVKFIDTSGLAIYLNRLYGNSIDIYTNNIFILSNQFLSPISDHSPDFYKFFITDTIQTSTGKLIELSYTPRNKGDLLFEGKLLVTMDGKYAVQSCEMDINRQININFVRTLNIRLDFQQVPGGRYFLRKSDVKADFGILRNKGFGVIGDRTVVFSNQVLNSPMPDAFYEGKSVQVLPNSQHPDTAYWKNTRPDTLSDHQTKVYGRVARLESMKQFKRATWIANTFVGGYANWGPVQLGPIGAIYSFNSQEGSRFQVGGRTTPNFNQHIYLEGYGAYGIRDGRYKYNLNTYYSFNKVPFYRYPNDYIKLSILSDVDVPGQNFSINNQQAALASFHTGKTDYWLYSKIFKADYVKEFENHFSFDLGFKNWDQQAAGTLVYQYNDPANTIVNHLVTSEVQLGLRFAPHEQLLQGTMYRRTIHSRFPIINLQINQAVKGVLNSSYKYTTLGANIYKRFYMSQLGYADITLVGGYLKGKVPFPLLSISPANQSLAYDPDAYNQMTYLEFVSDHYAGVNFTQSFNGFFLNKIPLIEHLKWREYLSAKILYGGLRDENNPMYSTGLYQFPVGTGGANGTYALGNKPYIEGGVGIGNIFKVLRVDLIRRFNYLDHPGVSQYGVKFSVGLDF
ncbi:carboxypeptidase-like regulatory domain-containing protein [Mucilaginibacter sp. R11]|uniref:Carboxypeptidase-like regulatory domain-containing protein n=1 Tax=Mucilaginibacter agri TaxID=2695265 RepID=A0A965ZJL0_9SPHI|nr:carboxypeptidase-like regulatory domain-containing protein [Mucilaginibacter agri]